MKRTILAIKDALKDLAHKMPFIAYRKRSKRYAIWNVKRERKFLNQVQKIYSKNSQVYSDVFVSIIMPVYNRSYCIKKAIESVVAQSYQNWELLIIDDGSTDGLHEVLSGFMKDKRIRYFADQHKGVSHARNLGIEKATGKYFFYLDADNKWVSHFLRTMVVYMETGNVNCCYSGVEIENDTSVVGYYGENFNWQECLELNFIDINSFGHLSSILRKGIR